MSAKLRLLKRIERNDTLPQDPFMVEAAKIEHMQLELELQLASILMDVRREKELLLNGVKGDSNDQS